MVATYRGVVRDGKVVLLGQQPPLAEGSEVLVTPLVPGTAAAVLAATNAPPHVPGEWVDELERLIAEGQRLPTRGNPFAEEQANQGTR
jgi:hypothetical protein